MAMDTVFSGRLELMRKILRSIDRPIEDMTVTDVCAASKVSRQTFYTYFKSKYDIAYWYVSLAEELYLFEIGRVLSLEDGLQAFFAFLYRERDAMVNAFEKAPSKREVRHRLERSISEFSSTLQRNGFDMTDDALFCLDFIVESANCLLASWCLQGMKVDPETMARRLALCVPALFTDALKRFDTGI
jgi:AcrR family transcriptional regulator